MTISEATWQKLVDATLTKFIYEIDIITFTRHVRIDEVAIG